MELPYPGMQFEEEIQLDMEDCDLEDGDMDCDPLFGHESEDVADYPRGE